MPLNVECRMVKHRKSGMDVEKGEYRRSVSTGGVHSCVNGGPGARGSNEVFDGMLVTRVKIASNRKDLSMMVLVDERVYGAPVQKAVDGGIEEVVDDKHGVQRAHSVKKPDIGQSFWHEL